MDENNSTFNRKAREREDAKYYYLDFLLRSMLFFFLQKVR